MADATQITIATGTTAYAADPDSEERIASREVRVEVTYQLMPGEDAALVASIKTAEVEHTRRTVWERLQSRSEGDFDPAAPGLMPPDDPFPDETDYEALGAEDEGEESLGQTPEATPFGGKRNGPSGVTVSPAATNPPHSAPAQSAPPEAEVMWSTKPQQMAIQSHCKRLGLSGTDLMALLRSRYGKFRIERLTKDEAAQVMRLLERGDVRPELTGPTSQALSPAAH